MPQASLVEDARKFSYGWRIWFWVLILVNFVAPLFFLHYTSAWLVLISYVTASGVIVVLHRKLGWVRLLGAGHFLWLFLLPFLIVQVVKTSPAGAYGIWLLAVIAVDSVAMGIDIVDVARYLMGERDPVVN